MTSSRAQAAADHNLKLVLERQLRDEIDKLNERTVRDYLRSITSVGIPPNFFKYEDDLQKILDRHDILVATVFTDKINRMVLAEEEEKSLVPVNMNAYEAGENAIHMLETFAFGRKLVPVVVSRYLNVKTSEAVGKISETTRKEAAAALSKAKKLAATSGAEKIQIASMSGSIFRTTLNGRTTGIVRLNTNVAGEAAKMTQIQILSGEEPSLGGGSGDSNSKKTWANMGDSLVRDGEDSKYNHLSAEQTVPVDKPFKVGGESLRFPGDQSLGAHIANVINCRCSATYDIGKVAQARKKLKASSAPVPNIPKPRTAPAVVQPQVDVPFSQVMKIHKPEGSLGRGVSEKYLKTIEEAWDGIPNEMRQLFAESGAKINIGKTLARTTEVIPDRVLRNIWGLYHPKLNNVHVAEWMMVRGGGVKLIPDVGRVLVHEVGHAIDKLFIELTKGRLGSKGKLWKDAWKLGRAKATNDVTGTRQLQYFVSQRRQFRNLEETFAESFSSAYWKTTPEIIKRSTDFNSFMKASVKELKDQVKNFKRPASITRRVTIAKTPRQAALDLAKTARAERLQAIRISRRTVKRTKFKNPSGPKIPKKFKPPKNSLARYKNEQLMTVDEAADQGTWNMFRRADGTWTPERQKLHDDIIEEFLSKGKPVAEGEELVLQLLGGGPASGKSSLGLIAPKNSVTIDVDAIRAFLPEFQRGAKIGRTTGAYVNANAAAVTHNEASYLGSQIAERAAKLRINTVLDQVGDGELSKFIKKLRPFTNEGYKIKGNYVTVDINEAIRRASKRALKTGRSVPEEVIRVLHAGVSDTTMKALHRGMFDEFRLVFGTKDATEIAQLVDGKLVVRNKKLWADFVKKAEAEIIN